jgi:L-idonate 5-dehydrogenase
MVMVGLGGDCQMPMNQIVAKELVIRGTFRFDEEFATAADLISRRVVDLRPMISATYPMDAAAEAFAHASDRKRATKVQLDLSNREPS